MIRKSLAIVFWSCCSLCVVTALYFLAQPESRVVFVSIFSGCIAAGLFFVLRPPTRSDKAISTSPQSLAGVAETDVWILVPKKGPYLPWFNAVSKEIGPCRVLESLPRHSSPRLLILPLGSSLNEADLGLVRQWLDKGSGILCECPEPAVASLAGLKRTGEERCLDTEPFLGAMVNLKGAQAHSYRSHDGADPGLWFERRIGKGYVCGITFEYGNWAFHKCQGYPNKRGNQFSRGFCWDLQGMQTHCLCTDDPPAHEFVPSLDVFDRALFARVAALMRIPGWWYHPDAKPSALVLSFDEDWAGPRLTGFENPDFPTTWFVVDDSCIDANALSELKNGGASFQVHWNRFLIHLTKLGLHVCSRSLSSQVSRLRAKTGTSPRICRIHYLRWDSSLDNLFWVMKECGIEVDSSLGPGRCQHGYRFGTGFPYFVGDKDGNPIGVEEIPFQIHDPMGESTLDEKLRLIHEAAEQYHTAVVALFHPYYCQPGHRSHKQYTGLLERIRTSSCWHASLEDVSDFWKARRSTGISTSLEDSLLRIRVTEIPKAGMTLRLPDVTSLESVVVNKREVESSELIVLQAGDAEVEARYSEKCSHEQTSPTHDQKALIEEDPVSNFGRRFS